MADTSLDAIRTRVQTLLEAEPFGYVPSPVPFDFDRVTTGLIDQSYRIEAEHRQVTGGMSYTETRQDLLLIGLARKIAPDPDVAYRDLLTTVDAVIAAIVRDGAEDGGDYDVLDAGRGCSLGHDKGQEFAVARLSIPVDYEVQL
jgi:hypothetical protein